MKIFSKQAVQTCSTEDFIRKQPQGSKLDVHYSGGLVALINRDSGETFIVSEAGPAPKKTAQSKGKKLGRSVKDSEDSAPSKELDNFINPTA
jgi:hypothetical protein